MDKRIWIMVGILVLVGLGFWMFFAMTGNAVAVADEIIEKEYFRISEEVGRIMEVGMENIVKNEGGEIW